MLLMIAFARQVRSSIFFKPLKSYNLVIDNFVTCGINVNSPVLVVNGGTWVVSNLTPIDLLVAHSDLENASMNKVIATLVENGATVRQSLSFQLLTIPEVREVIKNRFSLTTKVILNALLFQ